MRFLRTLARPLGAMLSILVLAAAFSAAVPARAEARSKHCKAACGHCRSSSTMTCCDTDRGNPTSLPVQPPAPGKQVHNTTALFADASAVTAAANQSVAPAVLRIAPPHGYRSTDLPTLYSVFLI